MTFNRSTSVRDVRLLQVRRPRNLPLDDAKVLSGYTSEPQDFVEHSTTHARSCMCNHAPESTWRGSSSRSCRSERCTDYLPSQMAAGGHVPSVFGSQPRVRPFLLPWLGRKQLCEPRGLVRLRCHQGLLLAIESISPPLLLPREGREELGEPRRLVDVRRHEHLRRRRLPPPRGLRVSRERREKLCKPRGLLRLGAQQLLPHGREGRGELRWRLGAVRRRRGGERRILPLGSGDGAQEGGEEEEEAGGGHTHPF
mmetsp:Transcript_27174/g.67394  ORF Transcript_27174/g.67394 Transcript_27174/m.67394 type:complete len:254 (+) Transcript_27174:165-926(+)